MKYRYLVVVVVNGRMAREVSCDCECCTDKNPVLKELAAEVTKVINSSVAEMHAHLQMKSLQ
jgi:hypothetical protein